MIDDEIRLCDMKLTKVLILTVCACLILCSCSRKSKVVTLAVGKGSASLAHESESAPALVSTSAPDGSIIYIINTSSKTIHGDENCSAVVRMSEKNKKYSEKEEAKSLEESGYKCCGLCMSGGFE